MPTGRYTRTPEMYNNRRGINAPFFGKHHTEKSKQKLRLKHTGKIMSEDSKQKMSLSHKGMPMHENTKKALLKSLIGNTHTKGMKMPESFGKKISERLIGNQFNKNRKHTQEWKDFMSIRMTGEKSPAWKGGITPINQKIRSSREYNEWERSVLQRDNWTCQKCRYTAKTRIVAHHILNFAEYPMLRFDINNGITLCRPKCHKLFHHIYGRKNNTREQLIEFLEDK